MSSPGRLISELQFAKADSGSQSISEFTGTSGSTFVSHTGMGREAAYQGSQSHRIQPGSRHTAHDLNGKMLSFGFDGTEFKNDF